MCSLQLSCKVCDFQTSFMTSPNTNTGYFDHDLRLVYAFRSIGKGEKPAGVFTHEMNMPPPPQRFHRYNKAIAACVEEVANESMLIIV